DASPNDVDARCTCDLLMLEVDAAEARTQQARQRAENRRLACAVRSDDARDRAGFDLEVESLEDVAAAVAAIDAVQGDERPVVRHARPPRPTSPRPGMRRGLRDRVGSPT